MTARIDLSMSSEEEIREKIRKLEEALVEGRISEETYRELKAKYEAELERLRGEWVEVKTPKPAGAPPRVSAESLGDLFNKALDFVKENPVVLVPPILGGIIGVVIMRAIGLSTLGMPGLGRLGPRFAPPGPGYQPEVPPSVLGALGLALLGMILVLVIDMIFNGWLIAMVKQGLTGEVVDLGSSFNVALSKAVPIIAASILVGIIVGIGFLLCVIPGIIAWILLALTLQAVVVDDYGPVDALKASYEVAKNNFFDVLIIVIGQVIISAIVSIVPYLGFILSAAVSGFFAVLLTIFYVARRAPTAAVPI